MQWFTGPGKSRFWAAFQAFGKGKECNGLEPASRGGFRRESSARPGELAPLALFLFSAVSAEIGRSAPAIAFAARLRPLPAIPACNAWGGGPDRPCRAANRVGIPGEGFSGRPAPAGSARFRFREVPASLAAVGAQTADRLRVMRDGARPARPGTVSLPHGSECPADLASLGFSKSCHDRHYSRNNAGLADT
jgi:hypothetical protein